jgi:splicing factor 3B subunit 4
MAHQGYGFCEFLTEEDAEYACKIMNQIKLWGKPIRVNKVISDAYLIAENMLRRLNNCRI